MSGLGGVGWCNKGRVSEGEGGMRRLGFGVGLTEEEEGEEEEWVVGCRFLVNAEVAQLINPITAY